MIDYTMDTTNPKLSFEHVITEEMTVRAHGSVDANVLATPRLLFMLEDACAAIAVPLVDDGQFTVGTRVNLEHLKPTWPGSILTVVAELIGSRGSRLTFSMHAHVGGELVAAGIHERAIVSRDVFDKGPSK